jgi:hypothetical protein
LSHEQVLGIDGTFEERLAAARADVSPDFVKLFDGHLVDAGGALIEDPADREAKIDFVVIYHMLIEGPSR